MPFSSIHKSDTFTNLQFTRILKTQLPISMKSIDNITIFKEPASEQKREEDRKNRTC